MQSDEAESGSLRGLRKANERRVLDSLRSSGALSQAELARRVGLSRSTINTIVRSMESSGELEVRPGVNGRETLVALAGSSGAIIAIDLGHQRLHGALVAFDLELRVDEVAEIGREHDARTDAEAVAGLVDRLLARAQVSREDVSRVCVGLHAPFDATSRSISATGILGGWSGLDIELALSERLGLPVTVENDANFAALAEWTWGPARGADVLLYVKASNGIGAGIIIDGKVFGGSNGLAGELGHVVVDDRGALCNCGNRGCLSAVASGRAVLLELSNAGAPRGTLDDVIRDARAGDLACRRVLDESGRRTGMALAHAVKLLAPSTIVIGGELSWADGLLLEPLRDELDKNSLVTPSGPPDIKIGIRRTDLCILGGVAAELARRGDGFSDIPSWMLVTRGSRSTEVV